MFFLSLFAEKTVCMTSAGFQDGAAILQQYLHVLIALPLYVMTQNCLMDTDWCLG